MYDFESYGKLSLRRLYPCTVSEIKDDSPHHILLNSFNILPT